MIRETKQKNILENELNRFTSFFSAEELFNKVKSKGIGIATVYRFLREKDGLHSYLCNRRTLYSHNNHSHSHFICTQCGKTKHIDIKNIDFLKKNVDGEVCHFQIDIHGICKDCSKK